MKIILEYFQCIVVSCKTSQPLYCMGNHSELCALIYQNALSRQQLQLIQIKFLSHKKIHIICHLSYYMYLCQFINSHIYTAFDYTLCIYLYVFIYNKLQNTRGIIYVVSIVERFVVEEFCVIHNSKNNYKVVTQTWTRHRDRVEMFK